MAKNQEDNNEFSIYTEVGSIEATYRDTPINIMENLDFRQISVIKMCEFYSNSRYLRGNYDELQREKPFYNIVNYRVTVAKVATDMDIKDINIEADKPAYWVQSMFLQHEAYEWMKEIHFDQFLNKSGLVRPKYGGVLIKKVETRSSLNFDVCDWRNTVTDQVDILGGAIIENHYMTPVELDAKRGSWDNVTQAIKEAAVKKQYKQRGYNKEQYNTERINVKEVHGEFPVAYLKLAEGLNYDEEDKWTYSRQRYFYTQINGTKLMFNADTEKENPYDYLAWEEMPGRGLGRGIIEDSEQSQVWTNDAVINEKNAMDLAGKVLAKTTDKTLGNNLLTMDNGKILDLKDKNDTFESIQLTPSALGEFQNQINRWQQQADFAASTFEANTGKQPPSGTPFSQTQLLNDVAEKPFDYRRTEMGLFVARLFEKWVIPFLIKRLYKSHIMTSEFSDEELELIDKSFAISEGNKQTVKAVLAASKDVSMKDLMAGKSVVPSPEEYQNLVASKQTGFRGNKRSIKFPDGYFDDIETKVTVVTTNEQRDKAATLQSLSTILQTVNQSYNPQTGEFMILKNPILAKIFGTLIELANAGISPINLGINPNGKIETSTPAPTPQPGAGATLGVPNRSAAPTAPAGGAPVEEQVVGA